MNDTRVKALREALEGLVEAMDATVRVERWEPGESIPEPLRQCAAELPRRLERAKQLSAAQSTSSAADAAAVEAMRTALSRLSASYDAYEASAATQSRRIASMTLEQEMGQTRADTGAW
jgi:hypothetical protein